MLALLIGLAASASAAVGLLVICACLASGRGGCQVQVRVEEAAPNPDGVWPASKTEPGGAALVAVHRLTCRRAPSSTPVR